MLRKKEDMKEWQRELVAPTACQPAPLSGVSVEDMDVIQGIEAPDGVPTDDLIDVPKEVCKEVKPRKTPAKKKPVKKKE